MKTFSLSFLVLLLNPFQTDTGYHVSVGLNEALDPYIFGEPSETLLAQLNVIDTTSLGKTTLSVGESDNSVQWTIVVTNEQTWVTPKLGLHPLLSYVGVDNDAIVAFDLFNPTIRSISLNDFSLSMNDITNAFDASLTLAPLQTMAFSVTQGAPLDFIQPFLQWDERITSLTLLQQGESIDQLDLSSVNVTRYGPVETSAYHLYRDGKALENQGDYNPLVWMHRPLEEEKRLFELAQPTITPLEQAKRWAEFVMYGDGMFAAGRVEEAFRSIEREYLGMHPISQQLIFEEPNTKITGINESSQQDTSTFREAVGRYNYLAARVENAQGLSSPVTSTFDFSSIVLP